MNVQLDLDRSSPVPLYRQLADQIERGIRTGAIKPGEEIGHEIRLAERLGVSRPTVRQAILHLVEKGLLVRRRGIGTHVVDAPIARPLRLTSLFDDLTATNQRPRTLLLALELIPAPAEVADGLGLAIDEPVVHLLRLRFAADQPLAIMENFLPGHIVALTELDLMFRDAQDDDDGVVDGDERGGVEEPRRPGRRGSWWSCWRGDGHSVVTSVTAARALDSSTTALLVA